MCVNCKADTHICLCIFVFAYSINMFSHHEDHLLAFNILWSIPLFIIIIHFQEMDLIITDPRVLALQRLYRNDIFARHGPSVKDINKSHRYAAYTQFTLFKYGKLGARDRRAVPSYCTWFIRNKFPDPNGHYIEYVQIW